MKNKKKIYTFDLDGTLCLTEEKNGHKNDLNPEYLNAKPMEDRIKRVNELYDSGHTIIIDTARGVLSGYNWFNETTIQLNNWGLKYHTLRTGKKIMSDYYIDDKGLDSGQFFDGSKTKSDMLGSIIENESGSGTQTKVYMVSRVLKEATDERMDKLVDEISFLESIPKKFKNHFPKIVLSEKNSSSKKVYYEMEHYELPTIRRLILSELISAEKLLYWTDRITKLSMEMYDYERIETPHNYIQKMHYERYDNRMSELVKKSDQFEKLLKEKTLIINDKSYENIPTLFKKIKDKKFETKVQPEFVGRWSHSDLHYSNILLDEDNDSFILIDPRGYQYCDYYYDFGKLWHSVNGMYELISSRIFKLETLNANSYNFNFTNTDIVKIMHLVKKELPNILKKYSSEPYDEMIMKTEFNECFHFVTLVPFLLEFDGKNQKALAAYLQATVLWNKFFNKYID